MSNQTTAVEVLDAALPEEASLAYTQGIRKRIVDDMTKTGIPTDKGEKVVLLATLSDMDKQTLTLKRIKSDDKNATGNAQAISLISELLGKVSPKQLEQNDQSRVPPELEHSEQIVTVEGETVSGTTSMDYNTFSKKFEVEGAQAT